MSEEDIFWDDGLPPVFPLEKGDKPFTNDDERTMIDKKEGSTPLSFKNLDFFGYANQYILAADKLIQSIDNIYERERLVLPIVFLYRHSIELQLKSILHEEYKKPKNRTAIPQKMHQLDKLWKKVRKVLEPVLLQDGHKQMLSEIDAVENFIKEFADIDASSQEFRYPIDMHGQPTLKGNRLLQDVDYINLKHIADKMARLDVFLSNAFMHLLLSEGRANKQTKSPNP